MKKNKINILMVMCLAVVLSLTMVRMAQASNQKQGGILSVSLYQDVVTCDPHKSSSYVDRQILQNVYNTLITYDENMNIVPELAESWTTPDDTTYIFKLKKSIKFHDGTEFNAEVVKFNLERVLDPNTKSRGKGEISAIESIEVLDKYTLRLNLAYPFSALLDGLTDRAGFMISPTAFKKYGEKEYGQHPVGTGPFKFVEWLRGDHLTVERFEEYWEKGLPFLDKIIFKPIPDQSVKLINLRSGTLDIIDDVMPKDISTVKKDPNLSFYTTPSFGFNAIRLNCTKPPFNNKALRQAIAYAIDRRIIWEQLFNKNGKIGHGPISPVSWAYDSNNFQYTYNITKAKKKLLEGGKVDGFEFTMYTKISSIDVQVAQVIQAQLKLIGVEMQIVQLEGARHLNVMLEKNYEANYGLWSGYSAPDTNLQRQFHPKGSANWTGYTNPKVTELIDNARRSFDKKEQKKLYSQVLSIIIEDAPQIFVYYYSRNIAANIDVKDFVLFPDGKLRLKRVWLER